jgi:uncharacterized protein YoaH (UPF0181 family)
MDTEDDGFATGLTDCVTRDGQGKMAAHFIAATASTYDLGSVSVPWRTIYATTINGAVVYSGVSYSQNAVELSVAVTPAHLQYAWLDPRRYTTIANWSAVYNAISAQTDTYDIWYRGDHALHPAQTNCIVGYQAYDDSQKTGTVGYRCTAFGAQALQLNKNSVTAGGTNTAIGWATLQQCVEGSGNTAVGAVALNSLTGVSSSHNNAFGYRVLTLLVNGTQNNCFGFQTANSLTAGNNNHAFGENTLAALGTGDGNHAFGYQCLFSKTSGSNTHAFGYQCLFNETSGASNTAFGYRAATNLTTKSNNVVIGYQACETNAVGDSNVVIGYQAGQTLNNGDLNVFIGYQAGLRTTSAGSNVVIGQQAGNFLSSGTENVIIGDNSGQAITTVASNVIVGGIAAVNLNGGSNTCVGYNAGSVGSAQTYSNVQCIGNNAQPTASNQFVLGNASISALRCQVTTITALSDERFKKNIRDVDIPTEAIKDLRIVSYEWIAEGMPQGPQIGIIAQELDAWQDKWNLQWLNMVDKSDPDRWEATPGKLLFVLLAALQKVL